MPKRVAVLMYNTSSYARGVCRGVAQYARSGEPWEFFLQASYEAASNLRRPSSFDGVIGFLGTFQVNFDFPDYIGLGKSVSRGFGTIKKINN